MHSKESLQECIGLPVRSVVLIVFNQEDDFYVRKILDGHKLLKWSDMKQVLLDAKKIGLESVKFSWDW